MSDPYIFISHSSKDNADVAEIVDDLQAHGINIWVDIDRLQTGAQWLNHIQAAIDDCAGFLVVVSRTSRRADWVMRECLYAMQLDKPLFIALIDDVPLPLLLVDRQYIKLTHEYEESIARLTAELTVAINHPPAKPPVQDFPEKAVVKADESNFFAYLETMDNGDALAKVARDLYQWAGETLNETEFRGRFRPALHARQNTGEKPVTVFSILVYLRHPSVQIPLDYLRKYPPFTSDQSRKAILDQLEQLLPKDEGFQADRIDRRPSIPLEYFTGDTARLEQFKTIMAEIAAKLEG